MSANSSSKIKIPSTGSLQLDLGLAMFFIIMVALLVQLIFLGEDFLDGNLRERLKPPGFNGPQGGYHVFGTDQSSPYQVGANSCQLSV